jgi:hypothetical protein
MARTKSPSGSKRKDETVTNNPAAEQSSSAPAVAAAAKPEPTTPAKANGAREGAKLAVVRTDSRATVMPINMEEEVRRRAYELSERRGFTSGHETEDWLMAESEVMQRYRQHSA